MEENYEENNKDLKQLCLELRALCNEEGIENDLEKSAEILHKLGLAYCKNSFDKIQLIQSVGLLNSAITRKRKENSDIKQELSTVCQFVLQQAKAQDTTANLIEKANKTKLEIESMRNQTYRSLTFQRTVQKLDKQNCAKFNILQSNKIKSIKKIQLQITDSYKNIMKDLSQYCKIVMGPTPCNFAVVGLGSLARNEITPYSDFEHIILLANSKGNENCLEYFRWFSVIFHIIVLNLQETIIPRLNIEYLNEKTSELGDWFFDTYTSGISFDGMMVHACKFPLGRTQPTKNKPWTTELIKPVDKMLEYLSDDVSLKNGYHLSDILTETCFVYGDRTLYDAFRNGILSYKSSKTREKLFDEIKKQVRDDLNNFATRTKLVNLKPDNKLNVKQMFYRTSTLFITALGKLFNTKSSSCFDIINELAEQRKITENTKLKLSYAVAIACEIRLSVYMKAQSQRDYIQPQANSETIFDKILDIFDKESIVSYFQITYCLQRELIKTLEIKGIHIYSNPTLMNVAICYALRLDTQLVRLLRGNARFSNTTDLEQENSSEKKNSIVDFDRCLEDIDKEMKNCTFQLTSNSCDDFDLDTFLFIARALSKDITTLDDKLELAMRLMKIFKSSLAIGEDTTNILDVKNALKFNAVGGIIDCVIPVWLFLIDRFDEALLKTNQAYEMIDQTNSNPEGTALFYFHTGRNLIALEEFEESLNCFKIALEICLSVDLDLFKHLKKIHIAIMFGGIGICLLKLDQYKESLICLKTAAEMLLVDDIMSEIISLELTEQCLKKCLVKSGRWKKAIPHMFQAAIGALGRNMNVNIESDFVQTQTSLEAFCVNRLQNTKARCVHDLGLRFMKQNDSKTSANYLQRFFDVFKKLPDDNLVDEIEVELIKCNMEIYEQQKCFLKVLRKCKISSKLTKVLSCFAKFKIYNHKVLLCKFEFLLRYIEMYCALLDNE